MEICSAMLSSCRAIDGNKGKFEHDSFAYLFSHRRLVQHIFFNEEIVHETDLSTICVISSTDPCDVSDHVIPGHNRISTWKHR